MWECGRTGRIQPAAIILRISIYINGYYRMILTPVATHSYAKEVSSNRASCQNFKSCPTMSHQALKT